MTLELEEEVSKRDVLKHQCLDLAWQYFVKAGFNMNNADTRQEAYTLAYRLFVELEKKEFDKW